MMVSNESQTVQADYLQETQQSKEVQNSESQTDLPSLLYMMVSVMYDIAVEVEMAAEIIKVAAEIEAAGEAAVEVEVVFCEEFN